jgi:HPr kinase/phosphorylase
LPAFHFEQVVERLRLHTEVELLTPQTDSTTVVAHADIHRPGMGLMGYVTDFQRERIQIFGESEIGYLSSVPDAEQRVAIRRIFDLSIPGAFVAKDLVVPPVLLEEADHYSVPLVRVPLATDELSYAVRDVLGDLFAPRTSLHGTLADVYGVGLLFTGRSGIGKSETVLDLVERGHRLVADDIVEVVRRSDDVLVGTGRENLRHLMEIRGVGIVNVMPVFGVRSIRMQKRVEVEVHLEDWDDDKEYDRHGLDRATTSILGVSIPSVIVPIYPGKNITVIAEVIAMDFMLKTYGIDSAVEFDRKLIETMGEAGHTAQYLKHDIE